MTHTYATLGVSQEAWEEVAGYLRAVGYWQAFHNNGTTIDMHGIALVVGEEPETSTPEPPKRTCDPEVLRDHMQAEVEKALNAATWGRMSPQEIARHCSEQLLTLVRHNPL